MALRTGLKELRQKAEEKGKSLHFILIIWNMYECEITILIFSDLDTAKKIPCPYILLPTRKRNQIYLPLGRNAQFLSERNYIKG